MNSKLWIQKVFTMCMTVVLVATSSMVALANEGRTAGEIVVKSANSETAYVTVNGEAVKSGRTVFSSSTISTSEGAGAIINLGKAGRIELAQNTTFAISFDDTAISGSLTSGSITVLNAARSVSVRTASGETQLSAGETVSADSGTAAPQPAAMASGGGNWLVFALVMGGAVAGIVFATRDGSENKFGGNIGIGGTVSPTR
ncbi:MAG: hypothetical protein ACKVRN_16550 [Pyrinomonadaceae bacterium]